MSSSWHFAEGDAVGPGRQVLRLLGGGRRYEAYLAWDDRLRHLVVVKVIRPDQLDAEQARRALEAEVGLLDRLAHPLLVRSFGSCPRAERPHLVLELVEGPRLSTVIRRYGVVLEQALPLALNLCSVLHYLNHERVVHHRGFTAISQRRRKVDGPDSEATKEVMMGYTGDGDWTAGNDGTAGGNNSYEAPAPAPYYGGGGGGDSGGEDT